MRARLGRLWVASGPYRLPAGVVLLVAFLALFIWRQSDQIGDSITAIRDADPAWVGAALAAECVAIAALSLSYVVVMRLLGYRLTWPRLTRLHLRRMAVATVTPAGSATSIYVFVKSVERDDVPPSDALLTIALRGACGYAAFVLLLPAALVLRRQSGAVQIGAVILAGLLVVVGIGLRSLLSGEQMPRWFAQRAPLRAVSFVEQSRRHNLHALNLVPPTAVSLFSKLASVTVMYFSLRAVDAGAAPSTALVGFVVANVSQAVSPVFGGFGVVELTLALALQQFGVATSDAIAAALIYRLCDLWFQLGLGLLVQIDGRALVQRVGGKTVA